MGRVFLMCSGARSRYFNSKGRMCSRSSRSVRGRPASSRATLSPASASRLHAQPPDAPEPTTSTSNFDFDWKAGVSDGLATYGTVPEYVALCACSRGEDRFRIDAASQIRRLAHSTHPELGPRAVSRGDSSRLRAGYQVFGDFGASRVLQPADECHLVNVDAETGIDTKQ